MNQQHHENKIKIQQPVGFPGKLLTFVFGVGEQIQGSPSVNVAMELHFAHTNMVFYIRRKQSRGEAEETIPPLAENTVPI